jgi:hypothetical protein
MSTVHSASPDKLRDDWLTQLRDLINDVQRCAEASGWSTRQIEKNMEDSEIGKYQAPALLLQMDATRLLLEPIARSAPGAEGVVDLYLMPAYDDIASLYFYDGQWHVHYMFAEMANVAAVRDTSAKPLSDESLREVLDEMKKNAV